MKSSNNKILSILSETALGVLCILLALTGCGSNEDESSQEKVKYQHNIPVENLLKNTCWSQYKRIDGEGRIYTNMQRTLSFTSVPIDFGDYGTCYRTKSGDKYSGIWYVQEDGNLCIFPSFYSDFDASGNGENASGYGVNKLVVKKRTINELVYYMASMDTYYYYTASNYGEGGDSDNNSSYEKPDIGFNDFTAYQTKLKVVYKIYNKDKAKVTSAKVYYGTSSNPTKSVSATVAGVLITANISGLKKGTTYYVKCVATGKGGTTTTGTTKVITNY